MIGMDPAVRGQHALRPILYLSPIGWNELFQRPQQLACRLGRRRPLSFVHPVGLRNARFSDIGRLCHSIRGGLHPPAAFPLIQPRYVPFLGNPWIEKWNRRSLVRQIRKSVDLADGQWILWASTPSLLVDALLEATSPALVVYDCMDRYAAFHTGATRLRIEQAEARLAARADLVLASADGLCQHLRLWRNDVALVPNGVDYAAFAVERPALDPPGLRGLPRPWLGYHGTIGPWLDYPLLVELARSRPGWSFVFIGSGDPPESRALFQLPNVHRVGPVPYAELPEYVASFDVGLIPFRINELTRCVHPVKTFEYLAAGLPIAASHLPELAGLGPVIARAGSAAEWLDQLERIRHERSVSQVAARRKIAAANDWEHRAEQIERILASAAASGKLRAGKPGL